MDLRGNAHFELCPSSFEHEALALGGSRTLNWRSMALLYCPLPGGGGDLEYESRG